MLNFPQNLILFGIFSAFYHKNAENYYFDQRLGCKAPKRWLKYTTVVIETVFVTNLVTSQAACVVANKRDHFYESQFEVMIHLKSNAARPNKKTFKNLKKKIIFEMAQAYPSMVQI